MASRILYCENEGRYTLKDVCADGKKAASSRPQKYSVEDKYAKYRREVKRAGLEAEGLL